MAQPVWITSGGSLGTVPEGIYYDVTVQAQAGVGQTVFYRVIAGSLPTNTFCDIAGDITGVPSTTVTAGQDAVVVGAQVTSKFTVRAYTTVNNQATGVVDRFCDRTFTITVSGVDAPSWITPAGSIGTFYDGTLLQPGFQFEYKDNPAPGVTPISLVSGQLPPGITISGTGLLSGYFAPDPTISTQAGFSRDGQGYSQYPYDFDTSSLNYTYQFTLQVTNGVQRELRTFTMTVWDPRWFNASTDRDASPFPLLTADNAVLPASVSNVIAPVIINPQGSIGTYRNDNFFAYQFIAYDYSNKPVLFEGFDLPPGLTLDPTTGWLYGYIPNLGVTEETYDFTIQGIDPFDSYNTSELYHYSVTFIGAIATQITWISPSDLGSIENGSTSTFSVKAVDSTGIALQYRLEPGSDSRLPQGLTLLPSGNIVGRVSFIVFNLDNNATTIDGGTTTFDLTYTFTVNAYSSNGFVSVFKDFTIHVVDAYTKPYNNLYIQCMPPQDDRAIIQSLLQDRDIFPQALLYRPDDPNFGVATSVVYNHAYGLTADTVDAYVSALQLNHYWKNLILGEIKTAQALDDSGNILYEVVYSEIIDDLINNSGESVSKQVVLPYPVNLDTPFQINDVYPNSLVDMRDQIISGGTNNAGQLIDGVGQVSNILPRWMYSKQKDGRVLGFTTAWVIAYTAPNAASQVAYNIQQLFGATLNLIDFKADRYELDRSMTQDWDPVTESWIPSPAEQTTFDVVEHYQLPSINITPPVGFGHYIGEELTMPGSYFTDTLVTIIGNTVINNTIITTVDATLSMIGATVNGVNIPTGTTVLDAVPGVSLQISNSATATTTSPESITLILLAPEYDLTLRVSQVNAVGAIEQAFCSGFAPPESAGTTWTAVPVTGVMGPAATSSSANIAESSTATIIGSINGAKLTVNNVGQAAVGQLLTGIGVAPYTYIVAPIFGVITNTTTFTGVTGTSVPSPGTYNNVTQSPTSVTSGTGAIFNIRKINSAPTYSITSPINTYITLVDGGAGYAVGDSITILGSSLGGVNGVNDLTFTLGGSISNNKCWTVSVAQTVPVITMTARVYSLTVSGDISGIFAPGQYITGGTIVPTTQIITQLTSSTVTTSTTASGTNNTRTLTVTSTTGINIGQLVAGTGVPAGTFVTAINSNNITISQALTATASGTYDFGETGGLGSYAVNLAQPITAATNTDIITTDAVFDIESVPGVQTIFDGGSVQFVSPANRITNTSDYDKYLLYPKDNVINNLPQSVAWLNTSGQPIEWVNTATPPNPEAFWNT